MNNLKRLTILICLVLSLLLLLGVVLAHQFFKWKEKEIRLSRKDYKTCKTYWSHTKSLVGILSVILRPPCWRYQEWWCFDELIQIRSYKWYLSRQQDWFIMRKTRKVLVKNLIIYITCNKMVLIAEKQNF